MKTAAEVVDRAERAQLRRRILAVVLGLLLVAAGFFTYLETSRGQTMCDLTCMVGGPSDKAPDGMVYNPEPGCWIYPC
jgi:hypothetical protein